MRACLALCMLLLGAALAPAQAEERVALVIGNSTYSVSPLKNPRNDAEAISKALRGVGFNVTTVIDANQVSMKRAMVEFGRKLRATDSVGLFYFAGHGVQVNGENYLIPVDANIQDEAEVAIQGISVNEFLNAMERAASRINIAIFDACRNNPFQRSFRSASRGLAPVDAPTGTIIAYATAPGQIALDGDGVNSPYTSALIESMTAQGVTIEEVFKRARREVLKRTERKQTPWETSSLTGDFFFKPGGSGGSSGDKGPGDLGQITPPPKVPEQKIVSLPTQPQPPVQPETGDGGPEALALFQRGFSLDTGRGGPETKIEAAKFYRQSAELGYPPAMHNLALLYDNGRGVARDDGEAANWYRRAADKGYTASMVVLGTMHEFGEGVSKDLSEALRWYRSAAERGDAQGMMELAHMFQVGKGVERNEREAKQWLTQAADKGVPRAMYELGQAFENGAGVQRNFTEAAAWYRKAVGKDYAAAKHRLAFLLDGGRGVQLDPAAAADLLLQAYKQGHKAARDELLGNANAWSPSTRQEIQRKLKDAGVFTGKIDGDFSAAVTKKALAAYARR